MSNGVPETEADCNIDADGNMPVMGNYPKGTSIGTGKDWGSKDDKDLNNGLGIVGPNKDVGDTGPKDTKF